MAATGIVELLSILKRRKNIVVAQRKWKKEAISEECELGYECGL